MWSELFAVVVVGRLCLSILPAGWPGYHDWREGGATLGASVLLGSLGVWAVPIWIPWGLLLAVRLVLLPGAMRPRHELSIPPGSALSRLLVATALGALGWAAWSASLTLLAPAQVIAGGLAIHGLLSRLRRPALVRASLLALYAGGSVLLLNFFPGQVVAPWLLGGAWVLAGWVVWRRTADRRARLLAFAGVSVVCLLGTGSFFE
jgi:hypothetical protein